jgi:hypothetical protein
VIGEGGFPICQHLLLPFKEEQRVLMRHPASFAITAPPPSSLTWVEEGVWGKLGDESSAAWALKLLPNPTLRKKILAFCANIVYTSHIEGDSCSGVYVLMVKE